MAKDKKSFIAYCDWLETFEECTDEEAGKLAKHLFRYVNDQNPEAPDRLTKMLFLDIKRSLKRDLKKFEEIREKRRQAGRKGGKQTQANQANASSVKQTQANQADSVNENVTVTVTDTVSESSKKEDNKATPSFYSRSFFSDEKRLGLWQKWLKVTLEKGKVYTETQLEHLSKSLNSYSIDASIQMLTNAIDGGWFRFYPVDTLQNNVAEQQKKKSETQVYEMPPDLKRKIEEMNSKMKVNGK